MAKTIEELQAALDREIGYSTSLNRKIDRMREQLQNRITLKEHQDILTRMQRQHEIEMAEIKNRQKSKHNERGAGRKKKATDQVILRVLELHKTGLSQENISRLISDELGIKISRTTVGEIVRGKH